MEYKRFSDFAEEDNHIIEGDKIKIAEVLNEEVLVTNYRIIDSKYDNNNSDCLQLQIELNNEKRVIFTGSKVLIKQIKKYEEHIPFITTIKQVDRYYTFS